jgi:hypothetical protein
MSEEPTKEVTEEPTADAAEALQAQLDELQQRNEQLETRAAEYDRVSLSPEKLAEYLGTPEVAGTPEPEPKKDAPLLGLDPEQLSDEGKLIAATFAEALERERASLRGEYVQDKQLTSIAGQLESLAEKHGDRFKEFLPKMVELSKEVGGIKPNLAWEIVTKEADIEAAKAQARKEASEVADEKRKESAGGKPGMTTTATQTTPSKSAKEAFQKAWDKLGAKTDHLSST